MSAQHRTSPRQRDAAPVLLRERDGDIAILTLNRPQARNSLSEALLGGAVSSLHRDRRRQTKSAPWSLAANGPAFCAGHDLKELTARRSDADGGRAYFKHDHDHLQRHDAADRRICRSR